jgi:hypothetical protein
MIITINIIDHLAVKLNRESAASIRVTTDKA